MLEYKADGESNTQAVYPLRSIGICDTSSMSTNQAGTNHMFSALRVNDGDAAAEPASLQVGEQSAGYPCSDLTVSSFALSLRLPAANDASL